MSPVLGLRTLFSSRSPGGVRWRTIAPSDLGQNRLLEPVLHGVHRRAPRTIDATIYQRRGGSPPGQQSRQRHLPDRLQRRQQLPDPDPNRPCWSATPGLPSRSPRSAPAWKPTSGRRRRLLLQAVGGGPGQTRPSPRRIREQPPDRRRLGDAPRVAAGGRVEGGPGARGRSARHQGCVRDRPDPRGHRLCRARLRHVPRPCCGPRTRKRTSATPWKCTSAGRAAACSSFPSIVAVGERAALPHAPPTDRSVAEGGIAAGRLGRQRPLLQKRLDTCSGHP